MYTELAGSALAQCASQPPRMPTVREQLMQQRDQLTARIAEVNAALDALDENPAIEKVLTLVGRTVRF